MENKSRLAKTILVLSKFEILHQFDLGNGYIREFIENGAHFINYEDGYFKYGNRGFKDFISNYIENNNIATLIYMASADDFTLSPEFLNELRKKTFIVLMMGDVDSYFYHRDIYYAQCADLVVVFDYLSRFRFQGYGINSVSFYSSYDKNNYYKIQDMSQEIDVSFVGNVVDKIGRKENIEFLSKNGINVETFGIGSRNGEVSLKEMVKIFNKSKINLNFTSINLKNSIKKELNITARLGQVKGRVTEIAFCGGFVLSEYSTGIEEIFKIDKEIVIFRTKEEMLEKIIYFLKNKEKREEIAKNGHMKALKDCEISTAIPRLIVEIEGFRINGPKNSFMPLYLDKEFIENYATFRVLMIAKFLQYKKFRFMLEELLIILKKKRLNFGNAFKYFIRTIFPSIKKVYMDLKNGVKH
jgi:spore maturation protein CgeB